MRTAIVIALSLGGRGNKIFKSGDTVTDRNFPEGNFDRLIKDGFIRENKTSAPDVKPAEIPDTSVEIKKPDTEQKEEISEETKEVDLGFGNKNKNNKHKK